MKTIGLALVVVVVVSAPARAQIDAQRWPLHLAVGSYMSLNGADLAVTSYLLGARQAREVNPLLAPFSSQPVAFGAFKMGLAAFTSYGILRLEKSRPRLAFILAGLGTGLYAGVVYHNARLYRQAFP
jgi:hypothetical protein